MLPASVDAVLKASEKREVLSRPFWDAERQPDLYSKVILDVKHDREAAVRIAGTIGGQAWGMLPTEKG